MKTFRILVIFMIVAAAGACNKHTEPSVTLLNDRFINSDVTVSPGGPLRFKWIAEKGKSDLASFTIRVNGTDSYGWPNENIPTDVYTDSTYMEAPGTAGDYTFSFIAEDADGNIGEVDLTVGIQ
jgi:hypothetical protein